jgi:uncharacterized protein YcbK (DUF882 family)
VCNFYQHTLGMHRQDRNISRRLMLSVMAGIAVLPARAGALPAPLSARRRIRLVSAHTGEKFDGSYRDDTGPIATAMTELSVFLRDFRAEKKIGLDVGLIDFLAAIMEAVNAQTAIILSAYRTPATNAMLAQTKFGAAENSQHLYGRALDIRLDKGLADAMRAARAMRRGGVGWYPRSGFLHIDTGPVRNWDLDERDLSSLLDKRQRFPQDKEEPGTARGLGKLPPELEQRSRLMPGPEERGRLLPGVEQRGRLMPGVGERGRLLHGLVPELSRGRQPL